MDLDLISLSLKYMQESWEGLRERQAFQGKQWWGREGKMCWKKLLTLWGRRGDFNRSPRKRAVANCLHRNRRLRSAQTGDSGPRPETPAYRKTAERSTQKRRYLYHPNSVFDVLGLVGIATKSSTRIYRETS